MAVLVSQPQRAKASGSRAATDTYSRGFALSVTFHAAVLLGVLFIHHASPPEAAAGSVELVILPPRPDPAPAAPPVPEPQQPAPSADAAPAPEAAPEPAQPPEPPVPAVPDREAAPDPAPPPEPPAVPEPAERAPARIAEPPPPKPRSVQAARPPRPRSNAPDRVQPPRTRAGPTPAAIEPAPEPPAAASAAPPAPPRPDADPAWLAGVSAWLVAHRSYPEMARALGRQGTVVMRITVDPDGHVVDADLVHGSGSESLDHAAEMLVRNAQLPPFPPNMRADRQILTIPVRYRLE